MELFRTLRLRLGSALLAKKAARLRRDVRYTSFENVKSIGLVWDASRPAEFGSLSRFHQKMEEMKKEVKIFAYFPGKNLPDQYTAIRYLSCIRKDELSKLYLPVTSEANAFINNRYDVLIDLNFDKHLPLLYITAVSKARLKVGLFEKNGSASSFDLMMELSAPVDIDSYLSQVTRYLEMIKDKSEVKGE